MLADDYWTCLTPQSAFLARVFVDHCTSNKDEARLENALPVVTALAFRIQEAYNNYLDNVRNAAEESVLRDMSEEECVKREEKKTESLLMIGEMLKLALNLDYADEIGRRKMFKLIRELIALLFLIFSNVLSKAICFPEITCL